MKKLQEILRSVSPFPVSDTENNINRDCYVRVGDLVVMNAAKNSSNFQNPKRVPNGTPGIVVGHYRYDFWRGRIFEFGNRPGKYVSNGAPVVLWKDATEGTTVSASDIRWANDHGRTKHERDGDNISNLAFRAEVWMEALPESISIYEGDTVRLLRETMTWPEKEIIVNRIEWNNVGQHTMHGRPMPVYQVTPREKGWGTMSFAPDEVELIERGDVWKWYNNQRDLIKYATLEDEVMFQINLGNYEEIECPETKGYHWPRDAILAAAKAGLIDVIQPDSTGMFLSQSVTMRAYKFTDAELGARANAKLIKGFE